jgi:hypothetical protein
MPRQIPRTLRAVLTTAAAASALALAAVPAAADPPVLPDNDDSPCIQRAGAPSDQWFCPLTQNNVPVYASPDPGSERIGWLHFRGPTSNPRNFFLHQVRTVPFSPAGKPAVVNDWWAFTKADRAGRKPGSPGWGYVPEVYFKGGTNLVPDKALPKAEAP